MALSWFIVCVVQVELHSAGYAPCRNGGICFCLHSSEGTFSMYVLNTPVLIICKVQTFHSWTLR
jgi:hypothetical protein